MAKNDERAERLAQALRANLRRRKGLADPVVPPATPPRPDGERDR